VYRNKDIIVEFNFNNVNRKKGRNIKVFSINRKNFTKIIRYVISLDKQNFSKNGIKHINAIDFFMSDDII